MTIRRRVFLSNLLMYIIPLLLIILSIIIMAIVYTNMYGATPFDGDGPRSISGPITALLILLITAILASWFLTHKIIGRILASLEIISQGVHQLGDGNLSYRIDYEKTDEFAEVCNDFNEMAERLNEMVEARQKDYQNRKELIAGISHDLRTPLTSIKAYVEGLEKGIATSPEGKKKYLEIIQSKINDLEEIINKLFIFSKMDMGDFPLNIEKVEIFDELSRFINENTKEYRDKGLDISLIEEEPCRGYVKIDITQFHNVLYNILENSVKYVDKKEAKAKITCKKENNNIIIRVTDNGPGVDESNLENIFEIFYRTDTSRKNSNQGSGIGLAIARKTMERFNGKISAENDSDGGLAIIVSIPIDMEV